MRFRNGKLLPIIDHTRRRLVATCEVRIRAARSKDCHGAARRSVTRCDAARRVMARCGVADINEVRRRRRQRRLTSAVISRRRASHRHARLCRPTQQCRSAERALHLCDYG